MTKKATKKPRSKKATLDRLQERLDALTGKGTESMRESLQAQIDALNGNARDPESSGGDG